MQIVVAGLALLGGFFLASAAVVVTLLFSKLGRIYRDRTRKRCLTFLESLDGDSLSTEDVAAFIEGKHLSFLNAYVQLVTHAVPPDSIRRLIEAALLYGGVDIRLIRDLNSRSTFKRSRAALYLGYIPSAGGALALDQVLQREKSDGVRLRLVYSIVRRRYLQSVPTVFDSLQNASDTYRERATGLLLDLGFDLLEFLEPMRKRREPELQMVFVRAASEIPSDEMREYLGELVEHASTNVAREAFDVLMQNFADTVDPTRYLSEQDSFFVNRAIEALGRTPSEESVETILPFLGSPVTRQSAVGALQTMISSIPRLLPYVLERYRNVDSTELREGLAEVLAVRAAYLVDRAVREQWADAETVFDLMLRTRKAKGVLEFLTRNSDPEREQDVCRFIGRTVRNDSWLQEEYALYAKDSVLREIGIVRREISRDHGRRSGENAGVRALGLLVAATLLLPFGIFAGFWLSEWIGAAPGTGSWWNVFPAYIVWFQRSFVFYAVAINSVYLVLLIAAVGAVLDTARLAEIRPLELLFKKRMLPSVSVIAPAYNEEATIVESVRALLNLRYPDYEVIVVNDGSVDATLEKLIRTFELERVGLFMHDHLSTRPVRGIYQNPRMPELVVVDKSNGGKADSLNAGINVSRKEYYAAIDADSLLEPEALLNLAMESLDTQEPVAATGGNVLPINGCTVELGHIDEVRLPRNWLARFQMVEYIRGFMTGRTGWARLNSLLIISGAFGLFNKRDVIDVRGYLTSSERLLKDTVAEDMELVVRLTRVLRKQGRRRTIRYAPGANCWTEVPESTRTLSSQRDRWQRGLIDVLFFHAAITLRPRFGHAGMIGMPYHFIFELVGPWIEAQGFLFLVIGIATGILPLWLIVAVLVASIGMGVVVSLVSLQLAEWRRPMFRRRDRMRMLLFAFLENLGYRQYTTVLRVRGCISVLRQRTGWGIMRRRGFLRKAGKNA